MHRNACFALERILKSAIILMMKGFISLIAVFVIVILLISALKINLRGNVDSSSESALNSNIHIIIDTGIIIWTDYIRRPIVTVWSKYILPFMKGEFLSGLKTKVQEGSTLPPE